jgi:anti-sigma-K factor RskA
MHCAGFNPDTYDRYVLGLLEEPDRSQLEAQIQEQCPVCLTGVQRSMNLWLVFAETLENASPSEDFRGRIVRIAELSKKVLTFPKSSAVRDRPTVPISALLMICVVTSILLVATWYAGRESISLDKQPNTADLDRLAQDVANSEMKLQQETEKRVQAETKLGASGSAVLAHTKQLEDSLLKAQADAEQYKSAIARDKQQMTEATDLLNAFSHSGAKLLPMKATEWAGKGLGYALLAENSRLVFIGSNLPRPPAGRTFQLWVLRNEEPTEVSAGVFIPQGIGGPTLVEFENSSLLSNVTGVMVTEEPVDGNYNKPTGPRMFEASWSEGN